MKKMVCLALALMLSLCVPMVAMAESVMAEIDWTPLVVAIIGVIGTAMSALVARVWIKYVRPWLEQRNLSDAAKIVVEAAEALLGRYCGKDKWDLALKKMKEWGFSIDDETVLDAIRAAWKQLDISQYAAGIKQAIAVQDQPETIEKAETFVDSDKPVEGL